MFLLYKVTGYKNLITGYFANREMFADFMGKYGERVEILRTW